LDNTTGSSNTASGYAALENNSTGSGNTASGTYTLLFNTTGSNNTASGYQALKNNTTGNGNVASGRDALLSNTTGDANTGVGNGTLKNNTTGSANTATGIQALYHNTTGSTNTATGLSALYFNTTGNDNVAVGDGALKLNTTGSNNTALGVGAGAALTNGNFNLYLGSPGVASESNTLRIGNVQTQTFIAGVAGKPITGNAVVINSAGQLGTVVSSARYKRDIQSMGQRSQRLLQLRPVTFRYKDDAHGQQQYGLIAEEVAKVYPELVVKGADGKVEGVQYHELISMLLNELQHQQRSLNAQRQEMKMLKIQNAQLQEALAQQQESIIARLAHLEAEAHIATSSAR